MKSFACASLAKVFELVAEARGLNEPGTCYMYLLFYFCSSFRKDSFCFNCTLREDAFDWGAYQSDNNARN